MCYNENTYKHGLVHQKLIYILHIYTKITSMNLKPLPLYTDWLHNSDEPLLCELLTITPSLILPWIYNETQQKLKETCEFKEIWIHSVTLEYPESEIEEAIDIIRQNKQAVQYKLLVSTDGMSYDSRRFGGDHQIKTKSGRLFTFSVRKDNNNDKLLFAIIWN